MSYSLGFSQLHLSESPSWQKLGIFCRGPAIFSLKLGRPD